MLQCSVATVKQHRLVIELELAPSCGVCSSMPQAYRRLLPAMEAAMKRDPFAVAPALAALVRVASDFNYRQRLLGTAVKHANSSQLEVRKVLSSGLRDMVEADQRLEASREVVLAIGRLAQGAAVGAKGGNGKGGGGKLHTELIEVMLGLPLGKAESAALQEDNYADADDDIKRGLNESSITQGAEKLRKAEAELLTEVFVVYLRIIRQRHVHGRQMLASALTGLARWGQQVNISCCWISWQKCAAWCRMPLANATN